MNHLKLNRRSLLRSAAVASATLVLSRHVRAQAAGASLPLVISIEAAGAWDPTFLCNPVADAKATPFAAGAIRTAGNLRYAPHRLPGEGTDIPELYAFNGQDFFQRWGSAITVFNGVDNETVSHDVGPRVAFSGTNRDGHPVLASLAAATAVQGGVTPPLAFITTGGYAETAGLIVTTRAGGPDTLLNLARANSSRPLDPIAAQQYHVDGAEAALRAYRQQRDVRLASTNAPRLRAFLDRVLSARSADADAAFEALAPAMAEAQATPGGNQSLVRSLSAVLGAMRNDACVAAHVDRGGFDTHNDHDDIVEGQRPALRTLLEGIDFLAREVEASPTLTERGVVVLVGSDFGRTFYNGTGATRGKDHWPVTSMMVLALGSAHDVLGGNRVVGGTVVGAAKGLTAKRVRAQAGAVVLDDAGIKLTPALVHQTLRAKLGIDAALQQRFSLPGLPASPLPFFG